MLEFVILLFCKPLDATGLELYLSYPRDWIRRSGMDIADIKDAAG
jgi:hypothetical protein